MFSGRSNEIHLNHLVLYLSHVFSQRYTWLHCRSSFKSVFDAGNVCKATRNLFVRFCDFTCIHLFVESISLNMQCTTPYCWERIARLHCDLTCYHEAWILSLALITRWWEFSVTGQFLGKVRICWTLSRRTLSLLQLSKFWSTIWTG